ncbi:hypothetical protein SPRG_16242 [Saprolegnia parasitica CBS 223.65]|uniref:Apple domain-containing protein n=1 Tax=Saprolegnia parasitica (strain CBS 223.65) TaxID=695850 RepID=A0A067BJE2_SAPPC|nr:hypothetical protein SPRG_16242 [Saprolegnia parasitica CBS 223.65]KDO18278.1 hypothetical protein SPRG_16242 [Saprolegnia parasitica CBS 223.65]|eukprot:XP_012211017.1 hypothetical protein SPRG_16242 [Saprolegnia parasitica CBS 223.65]
MKAALLKLAQGASVGKPGAHSAARSAPSTCSAPLANTDYTGQDLSNVAATSVNQCCAACLAVASCNAYSFKANVCYLKSGSNNQVSLPGVTAVALYRCSAPQFNVDYVGNDIGNVASPSYVRCCELCRNTAGCSAFSWASGVCYLKSAKDATTNTAGVTSATVL